jgi:hypothetical protein
MGKQSFLVVIGSLAIGLQFRILTLVEGTRYVTVDARLGRPMPRSDPGCVPAPALKLLLSLQLQQRPHISSLWRTLLTPDHRMQRIFWL